MPKASSDTAALDIHSTIDYLKGRIMPKVSPLGLFDGLMGHALLFNLYASQYNKSAVYDLSIRYIDEVIDRINDGHQLMPSFGSGLAGVGWCLSFLGKREPAIAARYELKEVLMTIDEMLIEEIPQLAQKNYGFVHGIVGVGNYFLERLPFDTGAAGIEEVVKHLHLLSVADTKTEGRYWQSVLTPENDIGVNIGLAHGMGGVIAFLGKVCKSSNSSFALTKLLLEDAVRFLRSQQIDHEQYLSCFPMLHKEDEAIVAKNRSRLAYIDELRRSRSRLAWCYGDLGIAYAIYRAGSALQKDEWQRYALDILAYNTRRKGVAENGVKDMGLCHGTLGIAHIFQRLYHETRLSIFKEAQEYWIGESQGMMRNEASFMHHTWFGDGSYKENLNLLEGVTGIGLFLTNYNHYNSAWYECLLL